MTAALARNVDDAWSDWRLTEELPAGTRYLLVDDEIVEVLGFTRRTQRDPLVRSRVQVTRGVAGTSALHAEGTVVTPIQPVFGTSPIGGGGSGSQGPTGPKGDKGPTGDKGPEGDPGEPGESGEPGSDGQAGADGAPGPDGDKGPDGDPGPDGQPGPDGAPGMDGQPGATGDKGPAGDKGPTGDAGPDGNPGANGSPGADGQSGADGQIGATGNKGPVGDKGLTGDPGPDGAAYVPVYSVLANGATAMGLGTNDMVKVTPTANATYTTTVPAAGRTKTILILTSGTTSRTITFGTGFKPTGTLATGTTSARVFAVRFISDSTNLYEVSRTAAIVA